MSSSLRALGAYLPFQKYFRFSECPSLIILSSYFVVLCFLTLRQEARGKLSPAWSREAVFFLCVKSKSTWTLVEMEAFVINSPNSFRVGIIKSVTDIFDIFLVLDNLNEMPFISECYQNAQLY